MKLFYVRAQWVALSLLLCLFSVALSAQVYVDVDATSGGDGTSWENAFTDLQSAIATASGDIWVAAGTYKPSAYPADCTGCATNQDFTFQLKDGVSLYGGFAGTETMLSERNIAMNPTILSGDIGTVGDSLDNVYHVVLAAFASTTPTTRLDGFTITESNANTFVENRVNGQAVIGSTGGGIYTINGTNTLANNILLGNAANAGGGIAAFSSVNTLTNNSLLGNTAELGGGIYTSKATNTLTNNSLSGNTASGRGGGISISNGTSTLTNNSLSGNTAVSDAGGIYISFGTNTLRNNSLSGNTAGNDGGGIYTFNGTHTLTNNSLSGNTAGNDGGGIYTEFGTHTLTNNIIWGNSDGIFDDGSTLTVTHSIVQGGFAGEGNLDVDPLFVNQPVVGLGTSGDLRLQACSPAINAGNNDGVPMGITTDLDGNDRIFDGTVDMGAYELQVVASNLYYVDANATGGNTGLSWADAFTDLQSAIAIACVDIWVAEGTYKPSAYPADCTDCATDQDFTFQLKNGVSLYGGFAGTETMLSERNIAMNPTILSGDIGTVGDSLDNVHHVVLAAFADNIPTTRLDGFTIMEGNANGSSSITVNGAVIGRGAGGGIFTFGGTNTLTNNSLLGNTARLVGGGIFISGGTNTLTNNSLSGNTTAGLGGGIHIFDGTHTLTNNSLSGNTAVSDAGGIYISFGTNTLRNNSLSGNTAGNDGGGIYTFNGTHTLTNNSLSGNTAVGPGGGIYFGGGTNTLTNNIIWGNSDGIFDDGSTLTVTHSIVQGGFAGEGNLDVDPLFVNQPVVGLGTSGDLRLQDCSPAINAGNDADVPMGITTDLDGNDRIFDGTVDMGAYELQVVPPSLYYVDADATSGSNTGLSWADAFTDLQSALASTCPDITEIWVAAGTYKPSVYPAGCTGCATDLDFTFLLKDGVSLYGGFSGTEDSISERDIAMNPTILSGDLGGMAGSVHHVVLAVFTTTTPTTWLDGFTIMGGNASGSGNITVNGMLVPRSDGGGIYASGGTNTLTNNNLLGNGASNRGGGIYTSGGTNTLTANSLSGNAAFSSGGGIYTEGGTNTLTNNNLSRNLSFSLGGGIYTSGGTNTLTNNSLSGNSVNVSGGGIYISGGMSTLTNNSLLGNSADASGGGIYTFEGMNTLTNNSLSGNTAEDSGGGIYIFDGTNTLTNNVIWRNSSQIGTNDGNPLTVTYSIVEGGFTGEGNLDVDPGFIDQPAEGLGTSGDLRLQACSPAIDAGTNAGAPTADLDGNARPFDAAPNVAADFDMGAYEYQSLLPGPKAFCRDVTVQLNVSGSGSTTPSAVDTMSTAACGIASRALDVMEFACASVGANTVTLTVTDVNNNTATCTATVTVEDDMAPAAQCQDVTVQLDMSGNGSTTPAAVDNTSTDACGIDSRTLDMMDFTCDNVGPNTVILTVTDVNSNTDTCTATVTVESAVTCTALPVEFLVFKGEYREKANELEWTTLSEINNDYFVVQHSMDGVNFEAIGTENGRGANNTLTDYRFSHQNPSRGVHYYRLKQLDFDGRFDYSDVISINVQEEEELMLYPNPAQDQLTIVNGQGVAFISNVLGQSVQQFSIAENQQTIQIDDLQDGHYFLRILRANGEIVVKKFVKR